MTEKKRKGFAAMTAEQRSTIAGVGGREAHARGTAYKFSPEKAREAAQKSAAVRSQKRLAKLAAEATPLTPTQDTP